jgi:hypothetical protein
MKQTVRYHTPRKVDRREPLSPIDARSVRRNIIHLCSACCVDLLTGMSECIPNLAISNAGAVPPTTLNMEHVGWIRLHGAVRRFIVCGCEVGGWGCGGGRETATMAPISRYTNTALVIFIINTNHSTHFFLLVLQWGRFLHASLPTKPQEGRNRRLNSGKRSKSPCVCPSALLQTAQRGHRDV